ncbi:MAG: hypothetical protein DLM57_02200 [Pseudonocardiales bacterium]|nr:MAG: hypothetical protein DLM57_02200 [Pseudonocardiales bacterium]
MIASAVAAAAAAVSVPAVAGLANNPSFSHRLPVHVPSSARLIHVDDQGRVLAPRHGSEHPTSIRVTSPVDKSRSGEPEPGDDHGGAGVRTPEPGDDSGGGTPSGDDRGGATPSGDDRGGATASGDDRGGGTPSGDDHGGATQPGDDHGGATHSGDDHGGTGGHGG